MFCMFRLFIIFATQSYIKEQPGLLPLNIFMIKRVLYFTKSQRRGIFLFVMMVAAALLLMYFW